MVVLLYTMRRVSCKHCEKGVGFVAMQAIDTVSSETVRDFLAWNLRLGQTVKTDALPALNAARDSHDHQKRKTPPGEAAVWLQLVHIMIGNMKKFINGTFHGVSSKYLQEYIDEFSYRFNRRILVPQVPLRLLNVCLTPLSVKRAEFG